MATLIKVTFKRVNGDNTGVYVRPKAGDLSSNRGILYMRNCPDGLTFYVNPNDEGNISANNWYKVESPTTYKLPDEKLYCRLLTSYCSWEEVTIDDEEKSKEETSISDIEQELADKEAEEEKYVGNPMVKNELNSFEQMSFIDNEVWYKGNKKYTSNSLNMSGEFSDEYDMYSYYTQNK